MAEIRLGEGFGAANRGEYRMVGKMEGERIAKIPGSGQFSDASEPVWFVWGSPATEGMPLFFSSVITGPFTGFYPLVSSPFSSDPFR